MIAIPAGVYASGGGHSLSSMDLVALAIDESWIFGCRMLERDEELSWDLADRCEPEDGVLWIYDIENDDGIMAFQDFSLDNLREIIADHTDRKD